MSGSTSNARHVPCITRLSVIDVYGIGRTSGCVLTSVSIRLPFLDILTGPGVSRMT